MKILHIILVFAVLTLVAGASSAQMERHQFEKSPDFAKLDLRAQQAWRTAIEKGDKDTLYSCMLKVADRLTPDQKNKLGIAGFKPGTIIQTIVTGRVTMPNLRKVAALDFVKVVELATPLNLKADPAYQKYSKPQTKVPATKPAGKKVKPKLMTDKEKAKAKTGLAEPKTMEETPSDGGDVPIYQAEPVTETADPERPLTSDEIQDGEPAIAPVDQAPAVVNEKRTVTQPFVEPVKE